jgi:hypothetical protein
MAVFATGSDGRLKAIAVAADLSVYYPTITGTTAAVAGIRKWTLRLVGQTPEALHHFESAATTAGMLWGEQIQGGTQIWEADVQGYIDLTSTSSYLTYTLFTNGAAIKADLVYDKAVGTGHYGLGAKIFDWQTQGPEVKGNAVEFTCKLLGHGALTALSTT